MWWTPQEEDLQRQAENAWGVFPNLLADPLDLAYDLAEPDADDPPEETMAVEDDGPQPAFQWHVPEGAPDLAPPLLNGFHPDPDMEALAARSRQCLSLGKMRVKR